MDMSCQTGQMGTPYGVAWGHLGATFGYDSTLLYSPYLKFSLAIGTNAETGEQQQPQDAACEAYNVVKNHLLSEPIDKCKIGGGYFGLCNCESNQEGMQRLLDQMEKGAKKKAKKKTDHGSSAAGGGPGSGAGGGSSSIAVLLMAVGGVVGLAVAVALGCVAYRHLRARRGARAGGGGGDFDTLNPGLLGGRTDPPLSRGLSTELASMSIGGGPDNSPLKLGGGYSELDSFDFNRS